MNDSRGSELNSAQTQGARLTALPFGEFLCSQELISEEQLLQALGDHWSNGGNIGTAICRQGFLQRDEVERQAIIYHSLDTVEI
jgi:hypothetical protein